MRISGASVRDARRSDELGEQPRLAHAGRGHDEDRARDGLGGALVVDRLEQRELARASDEGGIAGPSELPCRIRACLDEARGDPVHPHAVASRRALGRAASRRDRSLRRAERRGEARSCRSRPRRERPLSPTRSPWPPAPRARLDPRRSARRRWRAASRPRVGRSGLRGGPRAHAHSAGRSASPSPRARTTETTRRSASPSARTTARSPDGSSRLGKLDRAERVDHARRVARSLLGILREHARHERVELGRERAAREREPAADPRAARARAPPRRSRRGRERSSSGARRAGSRARTRPRARRRRAAPRPARGTCTPAFRARPRCA